MYLLAILLPPIAILCCGKPFQAIFNFFFCVGEFVFFPIGLLAGWIPMIHAVCIVSSRNADRRTDRIIRAANLSRHSPAPRSASAASQPPRPHRPVRILVHR